MIFITFEGIFKKDKKYNGKVDKVEFNKIILQQNDKTCVSMKIT